MISLLVEMAKYEGFGFPPADEEGGEVGRHQGGSSGEDVNCVGQQHRWLSPKAGERKV